jgi:hypothetical protein
LSMASCCFVSQSHWLWHVWLLGPSSAWLLGMVIEVALGLNALKAEMVNRSLLNCSPELVIRLETRFKNMTGQKNKFVKTWVVNMKWPLQTDAIFGRTSLGKHL